MSSNSENALKQKSVSIINKELPSFGTDKQLEASIGKQVRINRKNAGVTLQQLSKQSQLSASMLSKIENGPDTHISTVRKYVEALGATLRLDASFPANTPLALHLGDAFELEQGDENQLVFPLLRDEPFRPQRDVVLSIKPQYSNKILEGKKTVELRRRFPVSAPSGTVAYIYSTSPVRAMVGVAEIADVRRLPLEELWDEYERTAHIARIDFDRYFDGLDCGYALCFDEIRPLLRPIPLSELRERFNFEPPQSFLYAKRELRKALQDEQSIVSH